MLILKSFGMRIARGFMDANALLRGGLHKMICPHNFQLDPEGRCLSDRKCACCGKISRFWN
jgi:hypothetical protein